MISLSCSRGYLIRSVKPAFNHISLYFGNINLNSITNKNAERFLLDHYKKAKHSAVLYHRVLKAAFNKAIIWDYTKTNPFKGIRLPKIQWKAPVFITIDELKKIIDNTEKQVFKDLFQFAFFTGMRSAEIMNLKWDQVNLEDQKIQIGSNEFNTKSRRIRFIPIAEPLKHILIRNNQNSNNNGKSYVFSKGEYENFNGDFISKKFKKAVRKTGLSDDIHFHTLRASFGSLLLQKGIPISTISKLLGHSSILVTERHYTELRLDNLIDAVNSLNDIIIPK
jgi:integrase